MRPLLKHAWILTLGIWASALLWLPGPGPWLLYNRTPSVPVGWYVFDGAEIQRGDVVAFNLPASARAYARRRGASPDQIILKPVAALAGDHVRVDGARVWINGRHVGEVAAADSVGRPLPHWNHSRRLRAGEVFVLSQQPRSFDGRYFGPLRAGDLLGVYRPLRMFSAAAHSGQSHLRPRDSQTASRIIEDRKIKAHVALALNDGL